MVMIWMLGMRVIMRNQRPLDLQEIDTHEHSRQAVHSRSFSLYAMDKMNSGNHVCLRPLQIQRYIDSANFHPIPLFVLITVLLNLLDTVVCYMQSVQRHALKLLNIEARTVM